MSEQTEKIRIGLEDILEKYDKIELLSKISLITSSTKTDKVDIKNDVPGLQFLIGLSLKTKNTKVEKVSIETTTRVIKLLEEYFTIFGHQTNKEIQSEPNSSPKEATFSKEFTSHFMQGHNLLWQINLERYEFQHIDLLRGIFCQLDDIFRSKMGFTVTDAINMGYMIHESHLQTVSKKFMESVNKRDKTIPKQDKDGKIETIARFDLQDAVNDYIFDVNYIAKELSIEVKKIKSIVEHVSCKFGEQNEKYQTPLDENLFLHKPIIRISEEKFFCPQSNSLVFYLNNVFYHLLEKEKDQQTKNWEKYNKAKKRYLEERIVQYLVRLFPRDCIINNAKYHFQGKEYETDVLVAYDNKLLIFEAKAGMINYAAKRGGIKSIESNLKKIISSAMIQAQRVRKYVLDTENPTFKNSAGQILDINEENKHNIKFQLVNVTLEPLSGISANLKKFDSLGLFDGEYPWSVNLFDLDVITDIIDYPSIFIHYIEKRIASQKQGVFFSMDECTLFSIYLKIGTLHHSEEKMNLMLVVPDWSEMFDDYYLKNKEKPCFQKEEFVLDLIKFLEKIKDHGYTNAVSKILDIPNDVAKMMSKQIQNAIKRAKKKNRISDFTVISDYPNIGITFMASQNLEKLHEKLLSYCMAKKYQAKSDQWVGISKDITNKEYDYEQVLFIDKKWEQDDELEELSKTLPKIKRS